MKNTDSLVVCVSSVHDISKITENTKYINLDISNPDNNVIKYFINNGSNYLYSDVTMGNLGYNYVSYNEFLKAEKIINGIYLRVPKNLKKIAISKYLYISLGKLLSFDINIDSKKSDNFNLALISNVNNLWGALSIGVVNNDIAIKIYYYMCRRLGINALLDNDYVNLDVDNRVIVTNLYKDIPYIKADMQTRYFGNYNDDMELDRVIKYIKNVYNDYYLDKIFKSVNYLDNNWIYKILCSTQEILKIDDIKPMELAIIYKYLFDKYCFNYDIRINNLFLNDEWKRHFIMISYNNDHYSYNYKKKMFVRVTDDDIMNKILL